MINTYEDLCGGNIVGLINNQISGRRDIECMIECGGLAFVGAYVSQLSGYHCICPITTGARMGEEWPGCYLSMLYPPRAQVGDLRIRDDRV